MWPRAWVFAAFVLFVPLRSVAQFANNPLIADYAIAHCSSTPLSVVPLGVEPNTSSESGHKSPFLAAMLSLAVPGLGEVYVGDNVWRGVIFAGLEAGLWIEMFHWNHRGDDSTLTFQSYSDKHWSTYWYADSLDTVLSEHNVPDSLFANGSSIKSINRAERLLDSIYASDPSGDPFTHQLQDPAIDNQQYYEMISKYPLQYLRGWDNLGNFNQASASRAELNSEYDIGRIFLYGIFLNHALSAIDAALLARDHNSALRLHGDIIERPLPDGTLGFVPAARIEYRF